MLETHEWTEDFREFEAVLVCLNELGEWDRTQVLRAFGTFNWNDASLDSSDLRFTHEETGVMIRHDGAVVAIEFGQEKLPAALPDFFAVLASLGWRQAEVYHPVETMGMLLKDMGKAIPATMDLDVRPAASAVAPSATPEVQMLLNRGSQVLGGGQQQFQELAMQELQSMGLEAGAPTDDFTPDFEVGQLGGTDGSMDGGPLDVGNGEHMPWEELSEERPSDRQAVISHVLPQPDQMPSYGHEDEPRVASLVAATPPAPTSNRQVPAFNPEATVPVAETVPEVAVTVAMKQAANPAPPVVHQAPVSREEASAKMQTPEQAVFKLGRSAICFDTPDHPISADAIKSAALAMRAHHVEHLWPGMTDQEVRWDLISEIDLETPWVAEILASALMCGRQARALLASCLLSLRRSDANAQLRDALQRCAAAMKEDKPLSEDVEHHALALMQMTSAKDVKEAISPMLDAFGGLMITSCGSMFTDVRGEANAGRLKGIRAFSLRQLAESPDPMLYVVHVDALDGDTVHAVAGLIKALAIRYGGSMRRQKVMRAESDRAALIEAQEKEKRIGEAQAALQAAVALAREAGISV